MSDWFSRSARKLVAEAIRDVEKKTSAEIVVTVVPQSANYLHVDLGVGAALGAITLLLYIFLPIEFPDDIGTLSVLVAFAAGTILTSAIRPFKRRLVSTKAKRQAVHLSSCAVFLDQGLARTKRRTGMLVFVSLFEREAAIVPDVGVAIDETFGKGVVLLEDAVRNGGRPEDLATALRAFGDILAASMPITEDDVNELPDAVVA